MAKGIDEKYHLPFTPLSKEVAKAVTSCHYWCNFCDNNTVDAGDPSTGRYFQAAGHTAWSNKREYLGVLFAICDKCLITCGYNAEEVEVEAP